MIEGKSRWRGGGREEGEGREGQRRVTVCA